MRISDWSSDVCSSDLCRRRVRVPQWSILLAGDGARRGSARPLDRWAATERLVLGILRLLALSLHEDLFHVVDLHEVIAQRHDFGRQATIVDEHGSTSCRARAWQYVSTQGVARELK